MMSRGIFVLVVAVGLLSACAQEPSETSNTALDTPNLSLTPEQRKLYGELLSKEERGFVIPPSNIPLDEDPPKLSGEWIEQDGARICDGYMTRIEDEEYCSSEVPSDWEPFKFEGQTYYLQPLGNNGR